MVDTQTARSADCLISGPATSSGVPAPTELAIAGDMGVNRSAPTLSTPVTIYTVSTGELRQLGSIEAAHQLVA